MRRLPTKLRAKIVVFADQLDGLVRELDTYVDDDCDALRVKVNVAVNALELFTTKYQRFEKETPS